MATTQTTAKQATAAISFKTALFSLNSWTILRVPEDASLKLPSRGQTMVEGTLNGQPFRTPLEPDGKFSHWFKVDEQLLKAAQAKVGDTVEVSITPIKEWPEPTVPDDLRKAITSVPEAAALFEKITPMARWEWVRWTRSTGNAETRQHRIEVACSKLKAGERRPCCWNRNLCTEPSVSKSGILLEPTNTDD